ncbi:MAG: hypothetical protein NT052_00215 [Candidatus Shapirobacteria bacterium]|nr:hypothetical protein [Candidatus Shapirobacteria bacterium]
MAKMTYENKRVHSESSLRGAKEQESKKRNPWILNKTQAIHRVMKPMAARIGRRLGPSGIVLVTLLIIGSIVYPKDETQKIKLQLINNPYDLESHLKLAEKFLQNHQFTETEKTLLLTKQINHYSLANNKVLEERTNVNLERIWQEKNLSDPQDIKKLISSWEKIIEAKPDYRDGYLQLAVLNFKLSQK